MGLCLSTPEKAPPRQIDPTPELTSIESREVMQINESRIARDKDFILPENPNLLFQWGCAYVKGISVTNDFKKARVLFKLAAHAGHPDALFYVGLLYLTGGFRVSRNVTKASRYFELAKKLPTQEDIDEFKSPADDASQKDSCPENAELLFYWGEAYAEANGVAKDLDKAFMFIKLAAKAGYGPALHYLGICYAEGVKDKISPDLTTAVSYFRTASKKGHFYASISLGQCYERGLGVPQDLEEAYRFFHLAAHQSLSLEKREIAGRCLKRVQEAVLRAKPTGTPSGAGHFATPERQREAPPPRQSTPYQQYRR